MIDNGWVAALDRKLSTRRGSSTTTLTIDFVVETSPEPFCYHLVFGPDRDRAVVGPAANPDLCFRVDADTIDRIQAGTLSAEEAFLSGSLDLDGDATVLIEGFRSRPDA